MEITPRELLRRKDTPFNSLGLDNPNGPTMKSSTSCWRIRSSLIIEFEATGRSEDMMMRSYRCLASFSHAHGAVLDVRAKRRKPARNGIGSRNAPSQTFSACSEYAVQLNSSPGVTSGPPFLEVTRPSRAYSPFSHRVFRDGPPLCTNEPRAFRQTVTSFQ